MACKNPFQELLTIYPGTPTTGSWVYADSTDITVFVDGALVTLSNGVTIGNTHDPEICTDLNPGGTYDLYYTWPGCNRIDAVLNVLEQPSVASDTDLNICVMVDPFSGDLSFWSNVLNPEITQTSDGQPYVGPLTYQWLDGNLNPIAGETGPTLTLDDTNLDLNGEANPVDPQEFTLVVSGGNGCNAVRTFTAQPYILNVGAYDGIISDNDCPLTDVPFEELSLDNWASVEFPTIYPDSGLFITLTTSSSGIPYVSHGASGTWNVGDEFDLLDLQQSPDGTINTFLDLSGLQGETITFTFRAEGIGCFVQRTVNYEIPVCTPQLVCDYCSDPSTLPSDAGGIAFPFIDSITFASGLEFTSTVNLNLNGGIATVLADLTTFLDINGIGGSVTIDSTGPNNGICFYGISDVPIEAQVSVNSTRTEILAFNEIQCYPVEPLEACTYVVDFTPEVLDFSAGVQVVLYTDVNGADLEVISGGSTLEVQTNIENYLDNNGINYDSVTVTFGSNVVITINCVETTIFGIYFFNSVFGNPEFGTATKDCTNC